MLEIYEQSLDRKNMYGRVFERNVRFILYRWQFKLPPFQKLDLFSNVIQIHF